MRFLLRGYKLAAVALLLVGLCVALSASAMPTTGSNSIPTALEQLSNSGESTPVLGHKLFLPFIFKNHAPAPPETLFGVQMYGSWVTNDNSLGLARVARVSWIRWPLSWAQIEPVNVTPNQYNWTSTDAAITKAVASGHRLIVTIASNPSWAATYAQGPIDRVSLLEFAEFVEELVERYDGDGYRDAPGSPVVRYWQFYNEPDAYNRWAAEQGYGAYWGMHGDQYAEMLCTVYPLIKHANPNAKVVLGGIAYDSFLDEGGSFYRRFIDDVLDHGGGDCFDYMSFHYYPAFESRWNEYGNGLVGKTNYMRNKLAQYNLSKPMMVTEAGWHSNFYNSQFPGSPEIQSRYVVKLFTQAAAARLNALIWWTWIDPGPPYGENGLLTQQHELKTSFSAYQFAAEKIGLAQFDRIEPTASGMEGYRFTAINGRKVYVFWSGDGQPRAVTVSATQAQLKNMYGQLVRIVRDGDDGVIDGRIRVMVDANPVYVEVDW